MVENIIVTFTECTPTPVNGYNIQYRIAGSGDPLIDAGNFSSSPANIPVSYPDGTLFEGIIRTDCGEGIFGQVVVWGQTPEDDSCCRFGFPGEDDTAGEDRAFDLNTHIFTYTGFNDSVSLIQITNTGLGRGLEVSSQGNAANFTAASNSAVTAYGSDSFYPALVAFNNNAGGGLAAGFQVQSGATGGVLPAIKVENQNTAADGIGVSIDFQNNTPIPGAILSNSIISTWTDVTNLTSELSITGKDNAALKVLLTISGAGIFTLVQGLFDYADDTAAAAGTPVIPVNGLYRTGSFVKMRVA